MTVTTTVVTEVGINVTKPDAESQQPEACATQDEQKPRDCLDRYLDVYISHPYSCFSGCCSLLLALTVASIMTGCMGLTLDQKSAWSVHHGAFTRIASALEVAREGVDASTMEGLLAATPPAIRRLKEEEEGSQGWLRDLSRLQRSEQDALRSATRSLASWSGWLMGEEAPARALQDEEEEEDSQSFQAFYKVPEGGNVFTPKNLQEMCQFETILLKTERCNAVCQKHAISAVRLFYGGFNNTNDCALLPQATVDAVQALIQQSVNKFGSNSGYAGLLHPSFEKTGVTHLTNSRYEVKDADDVVFNQMFTRFDPPQSYGILRSAFQGGEDRFAKLSTTSGDLRVRIYVDVDEFQRMIGPDFALAMFSFIFVFCCMWVHLGSCFIAAFSMWQIVVSLPISAIIYRKILMVDYFEFLHVLVVYLVLGIGADDVFVLVDSWRHISEDPEYAGSTRKILRATWTRTSNTVLNTSFTTAVAFMSMSISKVMPMRTCGWYAALCIFLNYIFVITFTPATVVIYQRHFEGKRCCCPNPAGQSSAVERIDEQTEGAAAAPPRLSIVERFLTRYYLPAMSREAGHVRPVALACVVIMLAVGIQGAYYSSQLTPPNKPEQWFPDNHMWTNFTDFIVSNNYRPRYRFYDEFMFTFGIEDMDFDDFDNYKPDDFPGRPIFDPAFDLTTSEAQQGLLTMCRKLREMTCTLKGCKNNGNGMMALRQGSLVGVGCFLEEFQVWYEAQYGPGMPTGSDFIDKLKRFRVLANGEQLGNTTRGGLTDHNYVQDIGFIEGKLRYVSLRMRSTLTSFEAYGIGAGVRDEVQAWVEETRKTLPASLQSLKVSSDQFRGFDLGSELLNGLFSGCAIAMPVSFLVILFSTMNLLLAIYAVISVGFIVLGVLGFCKSTMGWDLGIAEAVAGVIVIGYSIDYVVHLAHIYCEGNHHGHKSRGARAKFAIENIGSTVFAGAITTAGSGVFMVFCFLTFFYKMALLICITIGFSFLFSLFFFMGLAFVAGPAERCGSIDCCDCNRLLVLRVLENA